MPSLPARERSHPRGIVGLLIGIAMPLSASAADIRVCSTCDHTTIQGGIAAAGPFDTIWVSPGNYYESTSISADTTIRSTGGSDATHWYGTQTNVLAVTDGSTVVVDGFTLHPWHGTSDPPPAAGPTSAASRGIQVSNATVHLQDVRITTHTSSLSGAAVWVSDSLVTIEGSQFASLSAESGGAIDANRSTITVLDSAFTNNTASIGGAIRCMNSVLHASYSEFADNRAADLVTDALGFGGAIRAQRCTLNSTQSLFLRNTAGLGGHVHSDGGELIASHTLFQDGNADIGGAVWFNGTSIGVNGSQFVANNAGDAAGAVYIAHQTGAVHSIQGAVFSDNTSGGLGGAVRMVATTSGAQLTLADSQFHNNTSSTGGGALSIRGIEHVAVVGSSFVQNESIGQESGGGAFRGELAAGLAGSLLVSDSYFCRNNAGAGGALAYNTQDQLVELLGNVWVENSAFSAGAVLVEGADLVAEHNNFLDNSASGIGTAGFLRSGDLTFESNIVAPTPFGSGAFHTTGTFGSVYSNYNLWWFDADQSFSGDIQARNVNGADELQAEPTWSNYDPAEDCADWSFEPGANSPVFDSDNGVIGATGGDMGPLAFADFDADGVARPLDCNDNNAEVYPGAIELCDGADNDCNGLIDDIDVLSPPAGTPLYYYDADNDGFGGFDGVPLCRQPTRWVLTSNDCDDTDRTVFPTAPEIWYDGVDQNCDGLNDYDQDRDGFEVRSDAAGPTDCNDFDNAIHPAAEEIWYDGIDQNCDDINDYDQDRDGSAVNDVIPDCDDDDNTRSPHFAEQWYDGIDQNCDNADDYDKDGDGQQITSVGGSDCDDEDPTIYFGAEELWYDGVDQDCRADNDYDKDGDGFSIDPLSIGTLADCNDEDPRVFPGQIEVPNDAIDQDCSGFDFIDEDGDGFAALDAGGDDCDDSNRSINPGAVEIPYDEIDQNCDGLDVEDADQDGFISMAAGGDDCDDGNSAISPAAQEIWYDGIDQNCDGANDFDQDGDLWVIDAGDCDDLDPTRNPGADEQMNSGIDLNCDGYAPVSKVTGTGCSSTPVAPTIWAGFVGLLGLGFRRRR